jgi:pimeloyl-ACP methyl ester carboxylesterase
VTVLGLIGTTVHPVREGEAARRQTQIDLAHRSGMAALAQAWLPRVLHPSRLKDAALMEGMTQMYGRFTPEEYEREVRALLERPDPRDVLSQIRCRTLVLSGREDPLCAPEQSRALAEQIQGSQLAIIDDCAHFPTVEQPQAVTSWLTRLLRGD